MDVLQKPLGEVTVLESLLKLPDGAILGTSEAAIFMRVSVSTMERMRRDGNGPKYIQVAKAGARSFNQKCRYQKGDLIDYQNVYKVSSSTDSAIKRGLSFIAYQSPTPKRSEFDLVTKRPFFVESNGHLISSVDDTVLQEVIDRLGRSEIEWFNPVAAALMSWSSSLEQVRYGNVIKKSLNFALQEIDFSIDMQKREASAAKN